MLTRLLTLMSHPGAIRGRTHVMQHAFGLNGTDNPPGPHGDRKHPPRNTRQVVGSNSSRPGTGPTALEGVVVKLRARAPQLAIINSLPYTVLCTSGMTIYFNTKNQHARIKVLTHCQPVTCGHDPRGVGWGGPRDRWLSGGATHDVCGVTPPHTTGGIVRPGNLAGCCIVWEQQLAVAAAGGCRRLLAVHGVS